MKIRSIALLAAVCAVLLAGCPPTQEPRDVPSPPKAPGQEKQKGESAGKVVKDYAGGLTGSIDKTRKLQAGSELEAIRTAVQTYYYENGEYPESLDEVADYAMGGTDVDNFDYDPETGEVSAR